MLTNLGEAVKSFLRVFAAALGTAIIVTWESGTVDTDWVHWGWKGLAAFAAAVLLTLVNMLRSGDTRFGHNASPTG